MWGKPTKPVTEVFQVSSGGETRVFSFHLWVTQLFAICLVFLLCVMFLNNNKNSTTNKNRGFGNNFSDTDHPFADIWRRAERCRDWVVAEPGWLMCPLSPAVPSVPSQRGCFHPQSPLNPCTLQELLRLPSQNQNPQVVPENFKWSSWVVCSQEFESRRQRLLLKIKVFVVDAPA